MDIRLIATETDYEEALAEIKRLWTAPSGSPDRNKIELLAMLAHRFERDRAPLPDLDPIQAIRFRMEQLGLERRDLLPIFGTTARISEVMSGARALTLDMIRKLHAELDIPLESLIQPAKRPRSRAKPEPKVKAVIAGPAKTAATRKDIGAAAGRVALSARRRGNLSP